MRWSDRSETSLWGWRRKLGLALGGAVVALVTLELTLRALGAFLLAGQAAPVLDPRTGERVYTILCIGDSWTQGAKTGRYPEFLVEQLNARSDGVRFRQINVGRAGTNSSQSIHALPAQIATHQPDLLLVLTGNNDHHNLTQSTYWKFQAAELDRFSILGARLRVFAHSLRVFRLARTLGSRAAGGATPNEFFERDRTDSERAGLIAIDPQTHRRQLEYNLTRYIELARRERIPIVFQTYFHFHGYRVNEIVRDVASIHRIPLVDHNRRFHTRIPPAQRESHRIADGHPNPRGYRAMAASIIEVLDGHGLFPGQVTAASRSPAP
jgi:lysophospholipase L1-like esterase